MSTVQWPHSASDDRMLHRTIPHCLYLRERVEVNAMSQMLLRPVFWCSVRARFCCVCAVYSKVATLDLFCRITKPWCLALGLGITAYSFEESRLYLQCELFESANLIEKRQGCFSKESRSRLTAFSSLVDHHLFADSKRSSGTD